MNCRNCRHPMNETDSVTEGGAHQTWYRCPSCAAEETVSQPYESALRRLGQVQRCSSYWPNADHSLAH